MVRFLSSFFNNVEHGSSGRIMSSVIMIIGWKVNLVTLTMTAISNHHLISTSTPTNPFQLQQWINVYFFKKSCKILGWLSLRCSFFSILVDKADKELSSRLLQKHKTKWKLNQVASLTPFIFIALSFSISFKILHSNTTR